MLLQALMCAAAFFAFVAPAAGMEISEARSLHEELLSLSYSFSNSFSYSFLFADGGEIEEAIRVIEDFFMNDPNFKEDSLVLVGEQEKIATDLACDCDSHVHTESDFEHLEKGQAVYDQLSPELQEKIDLVNTFTKQPWHPWNQDNHPNCKWLGYHTLGLLTSERGVAEALQSCGYGRSVWKELNVYYENSYADLKCYYDCMDDDANPFLNSAFIDTIAATCDCLKLCCSTTDPNFTDTSLKQDNDLVLDGKPLVETACPALFPVPVDSDSELETYKTVDSDSDIKTFCYAFYDCIENKLDKENAPCDSPGMPRGQCLWESMGDEGFKMTLQDCG